MKKLVATIKAWWLTYTGGIVPLPEEPKERLTREEALELFQGEHEAEWEDEG